MIRRIARERNAGVVLSSHLLSEIEGICDDVVIMNAGQVVAKGTVAEVTGQPRKKVEERSTIQSFDTRSLRAVREQNPGITTALLVENTDGVARNVEALGFTPEIYSPYYRLVAANVVDWYNRHLRYDKVEVIESD